MDSNSGNEVVDLLTADGMDGVYFDVIHKRIYVSGGRGFDAGIVFCYQQKDTDHYENHRENPDEAWCRYFVLGRRN